MIEPITYVILNHGRFGEELIKSAELIAGKTEHIHAVSLLSGMSIEEYYEEVRLSNRRSGRNPCVGGSVWRNSLQCGHDAAAGVFTPCSVRYQSADADRADLEAQQ